MPIFIASFIRTKLYMYIDIVLSIDYIMYVSMPLYGENTAARGIFLLCSGKFKHICPIVFKKKNYEEFFFISKKNILYVKL